MTRKELLENDGYWQATIDFYSKGRIKKKHRKILIKEILKLKNELMELSKQSK